MSILQAQSVVAAASGQIEYALVAGSNFGVIGYQRDPPVGSLVPLTFRGFTVAKIDNNGIGNNFIFEVDDPGAVLKQNSFRSLEWFRNDIPTRNDFFLTADAAFFQFFDVSQWQFSPSTENWQTVPYTVTVK